jgi:hypothetical protein
MTTPLSEEKNPSISDMSQLPSTPNKRSSREMSAEICLNVVARHMVLPEATLGFTSSKLFVQVKEKGPSRFQLSP